MQLSASNHVKRSARRIEMAVHSRLRHGGFSQTGVELTNLSFGGFCAVCDVELKRGEFVSIDLPDIGLVRARIAWCQSGRIGARFVNPVDIRRSSAVAAA